jgi:hypothetical protein
MHFTQLPAACPIVVPLLDLRPGVRLRQELNVLMESTVSVYVMGSAATQE